MSMWSRSDAGVVALAVLLVIFVVWLCLEGFILIAMVFVALALGPLLAWLAARRS